MPKLFRGISKLVAATFLFSGCLAASIISGGYTGTLGNALNPAVDTYGYFGTAGADLTGDQ